MLDERYESYEAKEAVDHGRYAGEEFDGGFEGFAGFVTGKFGEVDGYADTEGQSDEDGEEGDPECTGDEGE